MRQHEQQHVGGAMRTQVIHDRVHPPGRARDPALNVLQEVDPMGAAASRIGMRERFARRRTEGPGDVAFGAAAIINLLLRAPGWSRLCLYQAPPGITLRAHRSHLVQADHNTARRWCGVERFDCPLIWADTSVKCWSQVLL